MDQGHCSKQPSGNQEMSLRGQMRKEPGQSWEHKEAGAGEACTLRATWPGQGWRGLCDSIHKRKLSFTHKRPCEERCRTAQFPHYHCSESYLTPCPGTKIELVSNIISGETQCK